MIVLRLLGMVLFAVSAVYATRMWWADRQMQEYRLPDQPLASYLFIPVRWQKRLYIPEGHSLVDVAWRRMLTMYGYALLGMFLFALGSI